MALTGSCTTPCLFALVLDPAGVRQTVRLRMPHSVRDNHRARTNRYYTLSGLISMAVGSLPTLPHVDCSPRARLASGCSDLLCRTGCGFHRSRRVVPNGFYSAFTSFPPFTGFACRERFMCLFLWPNQPRLAGDSHPEKSCSSCQKKVLRGYGRRPSKPFYPAMAVWLLAVFAIVILVVRFGRPEGGSRGDLRDHCQPLLT